MDSLQPYSLGPGRGFAGFYGSCNTQDPKPNITQVVGRVFSPSLAGPWKRSPLDRLHPTNLSALSPKIEQPMVSQLKDGSFVAFFE